MIFALGFSLGFVIGAIGGFVLYFFKALKSVEILEPIRPQEPQAPIQYSPQLMMQQLRKKRMVLVRRAMGKRRDG